VGTKEYNSALGHRCTAATRSYLEALGSLEDKFSLISFGNLRVLRGIYAAAILLSFANRWAGFGLYWMVALMWLAPGRRIERIISE
jgi:hypothetical protein